MFDHIRTLLLNVDPTAEAPASALSVAPLLPTYRAKQLSGQLKIAYDGIFDADPDLSAKVIRVSELLPILHSADLVKLTLSRDARISYQPTGLSFVSVGIDQPITEPDVHVRNPTTPNGTAKSYFYATLTRTASNSLVVASQAGSSSHTISFSNGYTDYIPVPSGFACAFPDIAVSSVRHFSVYRAPRLTLQMAYEKATSFGGSAILFSGYPEAQELLRIFTTAPEAMTRLGAFCLALAYRIELA